MPLRSRPSAALALAGLIAALIGALINVVSAAYWTPASGFTWREQALTTATLPDGPMAVGAFRKAALALPVWRPLHVTLRARPLDASSHRVTVDAPVDGGAIGDVALDAEQAVWRA